MNGEGTLDAGVRFAGPVRLTRGPRPFTLTLSGQMHGAPPGPGAVALQGLVPADLPEMLTDVRVQHLEGTRYRIAAGSREWLLDAPTLHVHRDVGEAFYRAIPPRRVPLKRRFFWRLLLWLAASHRGVALLKRLRRRRTREISGGG